MRKSYPAPKPGRDGRHQFRPIIATSQERKQYLQQQVNKLHDRARAINLRSLRPSTTNDFLESKRWITAGLRQARGDIIRTAHVRGDMPTERQLIAKAYAKAQGVDELLERCTAEIAHNQPTRRTEAVSAEKSQSAIVHRTIDIEERRPTRRERGLR
jgi:hypothetical protein